MPELDLMEHGPGMIVGFFVGLIAFVPFIIVLVPVLRCQREASMTRGLAGVIASFAILLLSIFIAYLFARAALLAFSIGLIIGFVMCAIAVGVAALGLDGRG